MSSGQPRTEDPLDRRHEPELDVVEKPDNLGNCHHLQAPKWITLDSNASEYGWGEVCQNHTTQGPTGAHGWYKGGTRSLALLTVVKPILDWAAQHLEALTATYVPGVAHARDNFLSRCLLDNNE